MLIREFALNAVEITEPVFVNAFGKEQEYLRSIEADRLLAGFRETAGLEKKADRYPGGWENGEISGHTLGHYMVAMAQLYAATGAEDVKESLEYILQELSECQNESGYLFTSDEAIFDRLEKGGLAWTPWYTLHKILAGLLSVHQLVKMPQALNMAEKLGNWVYNRVMSWTEKAQKNVLSIEYGGMNDCLYELYKETGRTEYAEAAAKFDEVELFEQIADGKDVLSNKHANATIPKFLGALNRYLVLDEKEELYLTAAKSFFDIVLAGHTYVTGGNSEWEHFRVAGELAENRTQCNCETCTSYNMLKLAERLYSITGEKKYMDYYERTFFNAILGSQNPETGMTAYYQPMATGFFKAFSTPFTKFWCCTGTGMESFTKLNHAIYHTDEDKLYVNLYIASVLRDKALGLKLTQNVDIDRFDTVSLAMELDTAKQFGLYLRLPEWTEDGVTIKVNGTAVEYTERKGYLVLERTWTNGDKVTLNFEPRIMLHPLPDMKNSAAVTYGPLVLAAGLGQEEMLLEKNRVNVTVSTRTIPVRKHVTVLEGSVQEWFENYESNFVKAEEETAFSVVGTDADEELVFTPYYKHYDDRYGIYFDYYTPEELPDELRQEWEEMKRLEEERLAAEAAAEAARLAAEEEERRRKEEEERLAAEAAAEAARLAEEERLRKEEEERLAAEAAAEAARLAEEERLRKEEEECLAAEAAAEAARLAAEEEERRRKEEEERLAAEAVRLAEEERLRKEEEERLAAEAARLAEEERIRKEEEERLAAEAARLAEEERLRKEEEERLRREEEERLAAEAAAEAARLAEEERLRKEEEERLRKEEEERLAAIRAAEEAAEAERRRKEEEELAAIRAAEEAVAEEERRRREEEEVAAKIKEEAERVAAQAVADAERAAEIAEAKAREEEANLQAAKFAAERAEAEAVVKKAKAEAEEADRVAEAAKAAKAEETAKLDKAKESSKASVKKAVMRRNKFYKKHSVLKAIAGVLIVLLMIVLFYVFATPIAKGFFWVKDTVDTFLVDKFPKVANAIGVKGDGADVPVFKDSSKTVYYVEDADQFVADTVWPTGYQASVARLNGKEYICVEGNGLKTYYLNEIAENDVKHVYMEKGDRRAVSFRDYDFANPELLCPTSGIFNAEGESQYAFWGDPLRTTVSIVNAETLEECKIAPYDKVLEELTDVSAFAEQEEDVLIDMEVDGVSYVFSVPKAAGAFNAADYSISATEELSYTLLEDGLRFDAYVVSNGAYLGKVVGKMLYTNQSYVLNQLDFYAYAEEDFGDAGEDPVIPATTLESAQKPRVAVAGDHGERLLVPIRNDVKANEYDSASFVKDKNGEYSYTKNGETVSVKGIDVSKYQEKVDWEKVAASGVEFAMIRLGFRGMGANGTCELDPYYKQNVQGALKAGLDVGVYFFSQATNEKEAKEEAKFVLDNIKAYDITWPVVFDTEEITTYDARANSISREERTNCAKVFMDEIAAAGYTSMLYANTRWSVLKLDMGQLADYDFWYAYYGDSDSIYYPYNFTMWQYSNAGEVAGVNGEVDLNISFVDYGAEN